MPYLLLLRVIFIVLTRQLIVIWSPSIRDVLVTHEVIIFCLVRSNPSSLMNRNYFNWPWFVTNYYFSSRYNMTLRVPPIEALSSSFPTLEPWKLLYKSLFEITNLLLRQEISRPNPSLAFLNTGVTRCSLYKCFRIFI